MFGKYYELGRGGGVAYLRGLPLQNWGEPIIELELSKAELITEQTKDR